MVRKTSYGLCSVFFSLSLEKSLSVSFLEILTWDKKNLQTKPFNPLLRYALTRPAQGNTINQKQFAWVERNGG